MPKDKPIYDTTLARMAGNIAASLMDEWNSHDPDGAAARIAAKAILVATEIRKQLTLEVPDAQG